MTTIQEYIQRFFKPATEEVTRRIEIKQHFNSWGKVHDQDQHNHILQKAISIYLSEHLDMTSQSGRYELLEKPQKKATDDNDEDSSNRYYGNSSEREQLQKLDIGALPPLNDWIDVEEGVQFKHEINNGNQDDNNEGNTQTIQESTVTFLFRSKLADGSDRIDAFVNRAYTMYQEAVIAKHKKDKSRYMYMAAPSTESTSEESSAQVQKYKRYALGEDKTFESLFFEEKKPLLTLLDNFLNKSGKFGITGFPYKMGLLLHGPPGTGKTSLIKAIAQHTKRHIVNISLSKIKTNQELMDMMFDLKFSLAGEDLPIKLGFDKIVFVMEDVDCASSVVLARTNDKPESDVDDLVTLSKMEGISCDDADKLIGPANNSGSSKYGSKDKLNLSGLLNVLDGVVDSPGRILVMTTNHPEKLDTALIRPGRVNKKLLLGPINSRQTQLMVEHYFVCKLDIKQSKSIDDIFANTMKKISPAQVEQLCAEYDDIVELLDALAKLGD